jgi:HEAT repeat protein
MDPTTRPEGGRGRATRVVLGVLAVVVVGAVVLLFVVPPMQRASRIGALTEAEDANFRALVASDDEGLDAALEKALFDDSRSFRNRVGVAKLLLRRRAGFAPVERALRDPDLSTRTAALAALHTRDFFHKQILPDPSYRVQETVLEWIRREGDPSRRRALILLQTPALKTPEALPAIRRMIAPAAPGTTFSKEESDLRRAAVDALRGYVDCEAADDLLAVAKGDPEPVTRLRAVQALASLHRAKDAPCAETLPEERVVEAVHAALSHRGDTPDDRALRLGAMSEIARTPDWAQGKVEALRAFLAPDVSPIERRQALETLVKIEDPQTVAALPRYFHDPAPEVRSSAAATAAQDRAPDAVRTHGSLLVGYVRDERSPGGIASFEAALVRLQNDAGEWPGLPKELVEAGRQASTTLRQLLATLYKEGRAETRTRQGEAVAVERETVAREAFRHVARRVGLADARVGEAETLRDAFWEKARAGDVSGARSMLEESALAKEHPALFLYETGWLLSRS